MSVFKEEFPIMFDEDWNDIFLGVDKLHEEAYSCNNKEYDLPHISQIELIKEALFRGIFCPAEA